MQAGWDTSNRKRERLGCWERRGCSRKWVHIRTDSDPNRTDSDPIRTDSDPSDRSAALKRTCAKPTPGLSGRAAPAPGDAGGGGGSVDRCRACFQAEPPWITEAEGAAAEAPHGRACAGSATRMLGRSGWGVCRDPAAPPSGDESPHSLHPLPPPSRKPIELM